MKALTVLVLVLCVAWIAYGVELWWYCGGRKKMRALWRELAAWNWPVVFAWLLIGALGAACVRSVWVLL